MYRKRQNANVLMLMFCISICIISTANLLLTKKLSSIPGDFSAHAQTADDFLNGLILAQYPGFYIVYGIFNRLLNMSQINAVAYTQTFFSVFASLVTYFIAGFCIDRSEKIPYYWKSIVMLFLAFFGPIYSVGFNESAYYLGQSSYNAWHNPTNNAVKGIGLIALFLFLLGEYGENYNIKIGKVIDLRKRIIYIASAVCCVISVILKPSFVQIFLPSLVFLLFIDFILRRKTFFECIKIGIMYIPSLLIMLWQLNMTMYSTGGEGIEIAPFVVWGYFAKNIPLSFILSTGFPLYCLLFCRSSGKDRNLISFLFNGSIIIDGVAMLQSSLLAEKGARRYHGNFGWGTNLAIGYLFLFTLLKFLEYVYSDEEYNIKRRVICSIGYIFIVEHFIWGIWYFFTLYTSQTGLQCW